MIKIHSGNLGDSISMLIGKYTIELNQPNHQPKLELLIPLSSSATLYRILDNHDRLIGDYLQSQFSHIQLKWSCNKYQNKTRAMGHVREGFQITILFELNIETVLKNSIIGRS